jgi:carbohydrate-binding DOMON domain-containing protein
MKIKTWVAGTLMLFAVAAMAAPGDVEFKDPSGDDNGPGGYIYPTDAVYKSGSFDLVEFKVDHKGKKVDFEVEMAAKLEDPWSMGGGFAVQMIFIFIDTDGKAGSGHTEGLPGLNIAFAESDAWEKVVILSPQKKSRVLSEVSSKAEAMSDDIVVPARTKGRGKSIEGSVKLDELGDGDPATWGYQVVVQSNEGFPSDTDLLTRRVNEYEGQHRFGGGNDYDCDPHVIDILAGSGAGGDDEVAAQHEMLAYECDDEGNATKKATLKMVRK